MNFIESYYIPKLFALLLLPRICHYQLFVGFVSTELHTYIYIERIWKSHMRPVTRSLARYVLPYILIRTTYFLSNIPDLTHAVLYIIKDIESASV